MRGTTVETAFAAGACLIALAFALSTADRWTVTRARHHAAWLLSLSAMTIAAAALWVGTGTGWSIWSYRVFYLFGGIVNVPVLALGTVYLLGGHRSGDRAAVAVVALAAFAAGVIVSADQVSPIPVDDLPRGAEVMPILPRVLAAASSGIAATFIIGGALWSAVSLARGRGRASGSLSARRLVGANLAIAAGTLILSASGTLNARFGASTAFAITLTCGLAVIFVGFLATNPASPLPASPRIDEFRWPPGGDPPRRHRSTRLPRDGAERRRQVRRAGGG